MLKTRNVQKFDGTMFSRRGARAQGLLLLLAIFSASSLAMAGELTEQIKQTTDKILVIVQDPALKGTDKDVERQQRMRKEIDERFDWADMARSAYGMAWKDLNAVQRTEFTGLFGDLVNKNYMSKVDGYSGEKIQYKGEKVAKLISVFISIHRQSDFYCKWKKL